MFPKLLECALLLYNGFCFIFGKILVLNKVLAFLFLIILSPLGAGAQQLLPFTENFTKTDYQGDNQNWSVVQGGDGAMYFANNHFLLRYNGVAWEKYTLPDKTIIRSLFVDADKIYCGSYREFGYWRRNGGTMSYTSLTAGKDLFSGASANEEIWKIFPHAGKLYFQSFNNLFVREKGQIRKLDFPHQVSYCYTVGPQLYAATVRAGIFRLSEGGRFVYQPQWSALKGMVVHGIHPVGHELYFFTKDHGVYVERDGALQPWDHPLNTQLRNEVVLSAKAVGNKLAIGTSLHGLYLVDMANGSVTGINRGNALKNNAVLAIATDKEGDLWLGLDNGLAHIEINSNVSVFTDNSGALGSVYAVVPQPASDFLLATNHGLFRLSEGDLSAVKGTQGQVWSIFSLPQGQAIGHNDGTYVYDGGLQRANAVSGGWSFLKSPFDDVLFQSHYGGIVVYPDPSRLDRYRSLEGLAKPIRHIAQVKKGELWAADNYRGLYRLTLDDAYNVKSVRNVSQASGLKNDYNVRLFPYRGTLLFLAAETWYAYDAISGRLVEDVLFNTHFSGVTDVCAVDDDHFIIGVSGLLYLVSQQGESFVWQPIPQKYYEGRLIADHIQAYRSGRSVLVNLDDGFFRYDMKPRKTVRQQVRVEGADGTDFLEAGGKVAYGHTVSLQVIPAFYGFSRPELFYRLNNGPYQRVSKGAVTLNNLDSGRQDVGFYVFEEGKYKPAGHYDFRVAMPWYLSGWMMAAYVLAVAAGLFLYYRWNAVRVRQKLALMNEELRHDRDLMEVQVKAENLRRMQDYQKQILELELQNKSSEVAGKSLSIAKQTEIIDKIEQILNREDDVDRIKREVRKAIKINDLNRHEWEAFEANLNQIHDSFIERLTARYHNLTPKDIKLCIYLRMNLSSKEIAPLMNISFRSVELHRYRLRRKLGLQAEENLTKIMLAI